MRLTAYRLVSALLIVLLFDAARAQPAPDKTGTSPSVLSLPSGPGSVEGLGKSFQPLLNTGGAAFAIAIELPQGPAGWAPAISLSYNSGRGNSALGHGWTLDVGLSIERQTSKGFPRYRDIDSPPLLRDVFVFQGEELIPLTDGTYRLRTDEQHRRFQPVAATSGGPVTSWLVEDRDGGRHWLGRYYDELGTGRTSRMVHPFPEAVGLTGRSSFEKTFQWLEDAAEDVHGNRIEFDYAALPDSPGVLYLERVRYFPRGSADAYHVIDFFTEPRPDKLGNQQAGFPRRLARRYREIAVGSFFDGVLHPIRSYALSYAGKDGAVGDLLDQLPVATRPVQTGGSKLHAVTRFGSDREWGGKGAPGTPLPPTRFGYSEFFQGPISEQLAARLSPLQLRLGRYESDPLAAGAKRRSLSQVSAAGPILKTFDTPLENPQVQFADMNGDGLADLLDTRITAQKPHYAVALNLGAGVFGQSQSVAHPDGIDLGQTTAATETLLADRRGNGTVDIVQISGTAGERTTRVFANRANPSSPRAPIGFEARPASEMPTAADITLSGPDARVSDLDFDKSPDVLITDGSGIRGYRAAADGGWVPLGSIPWAQTPDGLTESYRFSISQDGNRVSNPLVQLMDIDGDRMPDLVQLIVRQPGVAEMRYRPLVGPMVWGKEVVFEFALPDGSLSGIPAELQLPALMPSPGRSWEAVRLMDVNGDGLADLVYVTQDAGLIVYLNCHGAALAGPLLVSDAPRYAPEDNVNPTVLRALDINGNGSTDLVFYHPASVEQFEFVDFINGEKPGLLQIIDNGIGLRTFIRYKPATADLVAANRGGHPWTAVSPLATWVVAGMIDDIGLDLDGDGRQDRYVTTMTYRDPYYDGYEKQFRGFAFVETVEWGDDLDAAGLPVQAPRAGAQVTTVTRYRYFTGAPDGVDNDEYVDGFDVEPRPVAGTVDEWSERGGREEDALKGRQVLVEIAHGGMLRDAAGQFDICAEAAADGAAMHGPYSDQALRCSPDKYVYERRVEHWRVRRLYRPPGAVAPKGRLSRAAPETVAVPEVSVSFPVIRASTTERIEANGLLQAASGHPNAPFPAASPRKIRVDYDYDDYGNRTMIHELGALSAAGGEGSEARTERINFVVPASKNGRVEPWILDRPASRRLEGVGGVFVREERFFYDGADFVGLPAGKLGERGVLKRRQARLVDPAVPPPSLDRAPETPEDIQWLSWPGDPRAAVDEWIDAERSAHDAYGNRIVVMDPLAQIQPNGTASGAVGHYVATTFDPVFHTFPVKEEKAVGGGHDPIVFEGSYVLGEDPGLARWGFGTPLFTLDANRNRTDYEYDLHGRLVAIRRPGDRQAFPSLVYSYRAADPHRALAYDYDRSGALTVSRIEPAVAANAVRTQTRQIAGSSDVRSSVTFSTGRAQRLLVLEEDEGGAFSATAATRFGVRGSATFEAQPYRQQDDVFRAVPGDAAGTALAVDGLGRTVLRREPAESEDPSARQVETRVQFLPLAERHFDAEDLSATPGGNDHTGTPTVREFDGLGRLVSVTEIVRASGKVENWISSYGWNAAGQLTWIRDSQENLRWTRFDGLGRGIAQFDLNKGPMFYRYDAVGNLVQTDDAKGQRILYGYDGLNRLVSEEYTTPAAPKPRPDVTYRYDAPEKALVIDGAAIPFANAKGFLVSVRDLSGEEHRSYDELGRPNLVVKRISVPGSAAVRDFVIRQTRDPVGRMRNLTYPDASALAYTYDRRGKTKTIAGSFGRIINDRTYDAAGHRRRTALANGVVTEQTYDPRLRPASIVVQNAQARTLMANRYRYDGASNLLAIADGRPLGEVGAHDARRNDQAFSYDDTYRLVHAAYPQSELAFAYDRLGSMTRRSLEPRAPAPARLAAWDQRYETGPAWRRVGRELDATGAHTLHAANDGTKFVYDANGNVHRAGDMTFTWDVKDRLVAAETKNARVEYGYDYTGRRVVRAAYQRNSREPMQLTLYPDQLYETVDGRPLRYVFDGETRIARINQNDEPLFYHPDHLGSTALLTDGRGEVVEENALYPFGELRNRFGAGSAHLPDYLFIQKEHDPLVHLHNFEARQLLGVIGRFGAVDPASSNLPREGLLNPQTLNPYAYAANNPLKFRDSSGRWIETGFDIVSLGFSIDAVRTDPSFLNVGAVIIDAAAVALPIVPGGAGLALKSGRVAHAGLDAAPQVVAASKLARTELTSVAGAADDLPTVVFSASKYPDLAANIRNAQLAGHPEILTYGGSAVANRSAALEGVYKIPKILSRDEYPFASTLEGGASAWIGHIPEWQNRAQGGILSQFYKTHELSSGSRFRVVVGE